MAIGNLFGGGKKSSILGVSSQDLGSISNSVADDLAAWKNAISNQSISSGTSAADAARYYYNAQRDQFAFHDPRSNTVVSTNTVAASDAYYTPEAIAFRLRMNKREMAEKGIEILHVRRVLDEIHVVLGVKDQTLILKDDEGSFPSDEFVAKLRLLL